MLTAANPPIGTARSEPPRKPGIGWPLVWLGITNWAVTPLYLSPTQQLNQPGPMIEAAWSLLLFFLVLHLGGWRYGTPLTAAAVLRAIEDAGVPKGVVNLITS